MSSDSQEPMHTPLALLPPPSAEDEADSEQILVNGTQTFKFDKLGPVVVNNDGTLSRIANWENMAPVEKERAVKLLVARNKVRLAEQEKVQLEQGASSECEDKLSISRES